MAPCLLTWFVEKGSGIADDGAVGVHAHGKSDALSEIEKKGVGPFSSRGSPPFLPTEGFPTFPAMKGCLIWP